MHCSQKLQKITKNPSFGGSRSFKVIHVNKIRKPVTTVLVIMSNRSVLICNRSHTKRANSGKITFVRGYPSLTPSFERNSFTQGTKFRHDELESLGQRTVKIL